MDCVVEVFGSSAEQESFLPDLHALLVVEQDLLEASDQGIELFALLLQDLYLLSVESLGVYEHFAEMGRHILPKHKVPLETVRMRLKTGLATAEGRELAVLGAAEGGGGLASGWTEGSF